MKIIHKPDGHLLKLLRPQEPRKGVLYVPSRFVLSFDHRGRNYVFNTLTKECLETALPSAATGGGLFDDLIVKRFLVPSGTDECGLYNSVLGLSRIIEKKHDEPSYIIMKTLCCNARCVYCYQEGMQQSFMSNETAEETLRFILSRHRGKTIDLTWYGGEPLLRESVIDLISGGLNDAGVSYSSIISTNGSLISPRTIEKMTGLWNMKQVNVSMDGDEQDYNSRKRYADRKDHYRPVMDAINAVSSAGITVSIRCNIDPDNISGVSRFIEDLSGRVKEKKKVYLYLSPLHEVRKSESILAVCEKMLSMKEVIRKSGFSVYTTGYVDLAFRSFHCMADGNGVTVTPDGDVYCCNFLIPESLVGNVRDGITHPEARESFGSVSVTREKCRNCVFLPECTPFSTCPKDFPLCREVRTMIETDDLRHLVDKKTTEESAE